MKKYFNKNTRRMEWKSDKKEKMLSTLDFAIVSSDGSDDYCIGFKNGLRYAKSLIDGNDPQYEYCQKQEPKIGHWINRHIIANTSINMIVCSECGEEFSYDAETGISEYNYCPNCGARMSESKFFAKVAESYCKGLQDGLAEESEVKEWIQ